MDRVVVDSNVLISAFLFRDRGGVPAEVMRLLSEGRIELCLCRAILDEVEGALTRSKQAQRRYNYTPETAAEYRSVLEASATIIDPVPVIPRTSRDPDDDVVLACAVAAGAAYLITGDKDLKVLGRYENTDIVTPSEFLDRS